MDNMETTTPMMTYDLADRGSNGLFGGSEGLWLFAILALMWGGGGFFGNKQQTPTDYARQSDVVYTSAFNQLQDENSQIRAEIQRVGYEAMGTTKDAAYNNLSEIRDLEAAVASGFAAQQTCCCQTQKEILANRYENAINTASINANTTAQTQKILDAIQGNRIAELQQQVNQLQMANVMAGTVKYPMASTYNAGGNPFFGGFPGGGNI